MFKYKWRVKTLSEFCPKNRGLLGMNVNRKYIKIRLRTSPKSSTFFPYHELLGTMLHELCHMKYSNHSAEFYDLLEQLRDELEAIMNGQLRIPFVEAGCGKKLGGKRVDNTPEMRRARLRAVENRTRRRALMGTGGGRRLGGNRTGDPSQACPSRTTLLNAVRRRVTRSTSDGVMINRTRTNRTRTNRKGTTRSTDRALSCSKKRAGDRTTEEPVLIDLTNDE